MRRALVLLLIFAASLFSQEDKLAVSILDLEGVDMKNATLKACFQRLETSLIESGRFQVIEKNKRDEIMKEQKEQLSGCFTEKCAVEVGQLIGADYLVVGQLINLEDLFQINIKIVDIEKGDIAQKVTQESDPGMRALLNGMEEASRLIVRNIALSSGVTLPTLQPGIASPAEEIFYGHLDILSEPKGATVIVDNKDYGLTPRRIDSLVVGSHDIILAYPGYERLKKRVKVVRDITTTVSEMLIPKTGNISILSEPSGAEVFIDEYLISKGKTPFDMAGLNVGSHLVKLKLKYHEEITTKINVVYNQNITEKFALRPLPVPITIFTDPENVDIKWKSNKRSSGSSGLAVMDLLPGEYELEFSHDGYEPQKKSIYVSPGDDKEIEIYLKVIPKGVSLDENIGFLSVTSDVLDSKLKISGVRGRFSLPLSYYELTQGKYYLTLTSKGYYKSKKMVDIFAQNTTNIDMSLMPKSSGRAKLYSFFIPGAGQCYADKKMKGFLYFALTIGSIAVLNSAFDTYSGDVSTMDNYYALYKGSTLTNDININRELYMEQVNVSNSSREELLIAAGVTAGIWITNLIDIYFFNDLP